MLFQRVYHRLGELTDSPDSDLALLTSRDDSGAVGSGSESRDAVDVGIVNDVHLFTRLRVEGTDFAVRPA